LSFISKRHNSQENTYMSKWVNLWVFSNKLYKWKCDIVHITSFNTKCFNCNAISHYSSKNL